MHAPYIHDITEFGALQACLFLSVYVYLLLLAAAGDGGGDAAAIAAAETIYVKSMCD